MSEKVRISDSVTSTDSNIAASLKAVKTAYDKAASSAGGSSNVYHYYGAGDIKLPAGTTWEYIMFTSADTNSLIRPTISGGRVAGDTTFYTEGIPTFIIAFKQQN